MKTLTSPLFFILLSFSLFSQDRWQRQIDDETFDVYVNPKNYNTIFVGGGGGRVYRSYNNGETWDTLIVGFLGSSTRISNLIIHPRDTNIILAGGLNYCKIVRSTNSGDEWETVLRLPTKDGCLSLNGKAMVFDPVNPDTVYIGDFKTGRIFRSFDAGATWDSITTIITQYAFIDEVTGEKIIIDDGLTIASMGVRPDSNNIVLSAGTNGEIFMSHDYGETWTRIKRIVQPDSLDLDSEITQVKFSQKYPLHGYISITYLWKINTPNGGIHWTTDGGYSWEILGFPDTSFWAVACKPYGDGEEVWAGGYTEDFYAPVDVRVPGVGIVSRTQDNGKTWVHFGHAVPWFIEEPQFGPRANVWSMRYFGPEGQEKLYMATEAGMYVLENPSSVGETSFSEDNFLKADIGNSVLLVTYLPRGILENEVTVEIYNSLGNLMFRVVDSNFNEHSINTGTWPSGVYYIRAIEGRNISRLRILLYK